jgi:hypothetical protein
VAESRTTPVDRRAGLVLPTFIVVGVQKGGTSSLAQTLGTHPDVFVPLGEGHFFDREDRFREGMDGYAKFFAGYGGQAAVGEKTPEYSCLPEVPARIAGSLPEVRLIWLFRNPVDRAYSHYWLAVRKGNEREPFSGRVEAALSGSGGPQYVARGRYVERVERYLELFEPSRMLYLLTEEFRAHPDGVLRKACQFLGVRTTFEFPRTYVGLNATETPRSVRVQTWGGRLFWRNGLIPSMPLWRAVSRLNLRSGYPPMDPHVRARLEAYYRPFNEQLAALTGLDLSSWAAGDDVP